MESLFFGLIFLCKMRQSIGNSICFTLMVIDSEVVLKKLLSPANLFRAQAFSIYQIAKIIVIDKNKDFVLAYF